MSDRNSAEIFGCIFYLLAKIPDERNIELAAEIWDSMYSYGFHPCQMDGDEELIKLHLAHYGEEHDNEWTEVIYKGEKNFDKNIFNNVQEDIKINTSPIVLDKYNKVKDIESWEPEQYEKAVKYLIGDGVNSIHELIHKLYPGSEGKIRQMVWRLIDRGDVIWTRENILIMKE
jgi:hypothetical protein